MLRPSLSRMCWVKLFSLYISNMSPAHRIILLRQGTWRSPISLCPWPLHCLNTNEGLSPMLA